MNTTTINTKPLWGRAQKSILAGLLLVQFAIAYYIGVSGLLANSNNFIIPPVAITVLIPVLIFLTAYGMSTRFRNFVLAQDIRILTTMQLWRVIGFTFLTLYVVDVLPPLFAWVAGLGDFATGIAAIFIVSKMDRDPDFVKSATFRRFHYFGLLDFAGALGTAALTSGAIPALTPNGLTSAALDIWPLNFFPSFIVPGFIIIQISALLIAQQLRERDENVTVVLAPAS